MPKLAPYTLAWSAERQIYILRDSHTQLESTLNLDSPQWHTWVEHTPSFAFVGQHGTYTVRREQIKQGDWYWYAYQRVQKRVRKKYLGKSEALTLQRFEEVAEQFQAGQTIRGKTAIGTLPTLTRSEAEVQLLTAKLRMPFASPHLIARTRLLTHLQGALTHPITLLCAPAGSGKSTLVSSWLRQSSCTSSWLSLDAADNDAARFWSYLFTALDALYPGVGEHVLLVMRSSQIPLSNNERVLTFLINLLGTGKPAVSTGTSEALLVLDDYHVISNTDIHRDMTFLLEHLPPHLHLIISTRSEPPLSLARQRLHGQLLELRAADLRFSSEEIVAFFAHQEGTTLSTNEIARLEEHTAGWAAGLQLVALVLRDQREHPDALNRISSSQTALTEYLGQEVLAQLPEHIQDFLVRTSLLEQLEGRLCEAVSDQLGGEETLAWLFTTNLFLSPLDESRRWYRYHPIFAEILRQRLQQSAAEQIPELHRRAANWYREQRMLVEAINHARAAGDLESIVRIVEEEGVELLSIGEVRLVMNWVDMLPRPLVFSRLRLFLYECWWRWYLGHTAIVAEMMREYSRQHGLPNLEIEDVLALEQTIVAHVDTLYPRARWSEEQRVNRIAETLALYGVLTMQRADGATFSLAACRRAVDLVAGMAYRSRIAQHLSTICLLRGDLLEASTVMEEALVSAISDGSATWLTSIGYRLVTLYEMLGQLHGVTRVAQEILHLARGKAFLTQGTASIFLGKVAYEHNDLDAAERSFQLAIASCAKIDGLKDAYPYIHVLLGKLGIARILLIRGNRAGAYRCLSEIARHLALHWVGVEVIPVVKGEYALLLHKLGDETPARQWLEEYPPSELNDILLLRQIISLNADHALVSAKVLLACQRFQGTELLLQSRQGQAEVQGRTGNLISWLILRALLKEAQEETGQALSAITRALYLAEPRGYLRVFLDEGAPLLILLYRVRDELRKQRTTEMPAPTPGYLDRLIALCKQEQKTRTTSAAQTTLIEPLSYREREVLGHISQGHSNREIAQQLVIALSTVKSHVGSIYTKLGVESRTQALAQARTLKLL